MPFGFVLVRVRVNINSRTLGRRFTNDEEWGKVSYLHPSLSWDDDVFNDVLLLARFVLPAARHLVAVL